jgi:hypothetical protein
LAGIQYIQLYVFWGFQDLFQVFNRRLILEHLWIGLAKSIKRILINKKYLRFTGQIHLHFIVFIMNFESQCHVIQKLYMKQISKLPILLCLLSFNLKIQAQNSMPAAGGNASGIGGSVSFTVGQVVYTSETGTSGSVAKGVQQPYEISVITEIEQAKELRLVCTAYPNPTTNFLTLKVENYDEENLSYQLYDNRGILLGNKIITGKETVISMKMFISGIYFLKLTDNNKEIKIFKIIKF